MDNDRKFLASLILLVRWLGIALLCGPIGSLIVHGFLYLLRCARNSLLSFPLWFICLLPICGGLLTGLISFLFCRKVANDGMDQYIEALHHKEKYVNIRISFFKFLATLITVGTGGAGTLVGPVSLIAGGVGEFLYRINKKTKDFFSTDENRKKFIICTAAGALGAILNAPIAGGILAAEVIYPNSVEYEDIFPGVLAGATGYFVSYFFGYVHHYETYLPDVFTFKMLLPVVIVGIVSGMFSHFFIRMKRYFQGMFSKWSIPFWIKPAIGVSLVSILFLFLGKSILGTGMFTLRGILLHSADFGLLFLCFYLFARMFAVIFTVTSGGSAGFTGTSIVLGCTLGLICAKLLGYIMPVNIHILMVTGIAGVLSGVVNVPITAMILTVELFGWGYIMPGAFGSVIGFIMVRELVIYDYEQVC